MPLHVILAFAFLGIVIVVVFIADPLFASMFFGAIGSVGAIAIIGEWWDDR